jgi:hypothetical protein
MAPSIARRLRLSRENSPSDFRSFFVSSVMAGGVLLRAGTLHVGDNFIAGTVAGKVRALIDDRGRQVRPIAIESLRASSMSERVYFPSISPFRRAFRVVFPTKHEDGQPTIPREALFTVLRFTGPQGHVDLKWDFTPP